MNTNYIDIDGKYYGIDVEKIMEFVSEDSDSTQTISQNYGIPITEDAAQSSIKLISKEVSETKDNISENLSNIRYTLVTTLLNLILVPISDGNGNLILTETLKNMHVGQAISFNTLIEMGIIYEIENND